MNKKVIGILVCALMITTAIPAMGIHGSNSDLIENIYDDDTFCKDFKECYSEGGNSYDEIAVNVENNDYIPGTNIIETTWHQSGLYAMKTPLENPFGDPDNPDNHWRLGCWSTAIGQIINYHQLQSRGHAHYTCNGAFDTNGDKVVIDNDLDDHMYNWSYMPRKLYSGDPQEIIDSVSTFLYDVSTVIQKDFGTGTYCIGHSKMITELQDHFEFISSETKWVSFPSTTSIEEEIDDFRPCMLYIRKQDQSGYHAVVIDGYKWENDEFYVHINFGWGGSRDGWYDYSGPIYTYDDNNFRYTMFIRPSNYRPCVPCDPDPGDRSTGLPININLSWCSNPDPDDTVTYDVYFGTTTHPPKVISGLHFTTYNPGTLDYYSRYYWQIVAFDDHGNNIEGPVWHFTTCIDPDNVPPGIPDIDGPTSGSAGTDYTYILVTTDQNVDNVSYYIDWGDGTNSGWTTYSESGGNVELIHKWDEQNTYIIKAKAKDIYGAESDWTTLEVSMPKNKAINPFILFLERLIERFPILEQILQPIYDKLAGF